MNRRGFFGSIVLTMFSLPLVIKRAIADDISPIPMRDAEWLRYLRSSITNPNVVVTFSRSEGFGQTVIQDFGWDT